MNPDRRTQELAAVRKVIAQQQAVIREQRRIAEQACRDNHALVLRLLESGWSKGERT